MRVFSRAICLFSFLVCSPNLLACDFTNAIKRIQLRVESQMKKFEKKEADVIVYRNPLQKLVRSISKSSIHKSSSVNGEQLKDWELTDQSLKHLIHLQEYLEYVNGGSLVFNLDGQNILNQLISYLRYEGNPQALINNIYRLNKEVMPAYFEGHRFKESSMYGLNFYFYYRNMLKMELVEKGMFCDEESTECTQSYIRFSNFFDTKSLIDD